MTKRFSWVSCRAWRISRCPSGERPTRLREATVRILLEALHGRLEHAAILVAELSPGGERAGYVFATTKHDYFTRAAHAHVEVIAVTPDAERRGVARLLMQAVEQWAGRRGYRHVTLNVFDRNARARALYDSLGYEAESIHFRKNL